MQLYHSKKIEHTETMVKNKLLEEDLANNNNNNDIIDDKPVEKTIFIDRIMKLALEDKVFTEQNVLDELKTVLLAVSIQFNIYFMILLTFIVRFIHRDMRQRPQQLQIFVHCFQYIRIHKRNCLKRFEVFYRIKIWMLLRRT